MEVFDEAGARLNEDRLFAYADKHLSQESLAEAVPDGFDFVDVNRNSYDRRGKKWMTVGVRIEGPVEFARAIFYVHPDEAAAQDMFARQSQLGEAIPGDRPDKQAEPWSEGGLDVENRCHVRSESLFWCHAHQANVYLVTQSTAGGSIGGATRAERSAARTLLNGFGAYLQEEIPEE